MSDEEVSEQTPDVPQCEECGSNDIQDDANGFPCCQQCGLVQSSLSIDYGKDNRVFSDGSGMESERWGMPKTDLIHDGGLSTDISWQNKDYSGNPLAKGMASKIHRLRRQHQRTRIKDATERNLVVALAELQRLAGQMGLPQTIKESAARHYKNAVKMKLVRGRSIEGVVAASLYLSCRMADAPRTLDEVGHYSRTGRKEIGRTYRAIVKALKIKVPPAEPHGYVPRFCTSLNLPTPVQVRALRLVHENEKSNGMAGRGPTGIAAAAVYLAAMLKGHNRTQREVAVAAGVTEVTIRNRFKEMCADFGFNPSNPQEDDLKKDE